MSSYVRIVSLSSGRSSKSNQDHQKSKKKHLIHSVPRIVTLNRAQIRACAYIVFLRSSSHIFMLLP
jgi:hypothetical protein